MKNLKFCFAASFILYLISTSLLAQDLVQWRVDKEVDSTGYHLIIVKDELESERLGFGFGFKINIEDFYFPDSNTVCIVWESPIHFGYYKLKKSEDEWELEIIGSLGSTNKSNTSAFIPNKDTRPRSVRILEEDLVLIKKGDEEYIQFDCKDFLLEREAWLEGADAYMKFREYIRDKYSN